MARLVIPDGEEWGNNRRIKFNYDKESYVDFFDECVTNIEKKIPECDAYENIHVDTWVSPESYHQLNNLYERVDPDCILEIHGRSFGVMLFLSGVTVCSDVHPTHKNWTRVKLRLADGFAQ